MRLQRRSRPSSASSRAASTRPPSATENRSRCGGGASWTSPGLPAPDEGVGIAPGGLADLVELLHVLGSQLHRERAHVVLELLDGAGADDHRAHFWPGE